MSLKSKVGRLEKKLKPRVNVEELRASVVRFVQCGLLPNSIDVDSTVQELATAGMSLSDIVREVLEEIDGLGRGKLPSEEED